MHDHVYKLLMKFTWDENKRQANLKKHQLDFADAEKVFAGDVFIFEVPHTNLCKVVGMVRLPMQ